MSKNDPLKGKTIGELSNLDMLEFSRMSRAELSRVVSRLSSAANKRMKRIEEKGYKHNPAYKSAEKSGGKFGAKGKTLNQLRSEYMRVTRFLQAKTSTVKGYKQVQIEAAKRIGIPDDVTISENDWSDFWDFYNKVEHIVMAFVPYVSKQKYVFDFFIENRDEFEFSDDESDDDSNSGMKGMIKALKKNLGIEDDDEPKRDISEFFEVKE